MTKKNIFILTAAFLAVACAYYYMYRDLFKKPIIQISHTIRTRPNATPQDVLNSVAFGLGTPYQLTCVKVIPIPELKTNKFAHPIWELDSDSNSIPIQAFSYGMHIRGMHPSVKGAQPSPLTFNVPYRVIVEAGRVKGEHDFTIADENQPGQ